MNADSRPVCGAMLRPRHEGIALACGAVRGQRNMPTRSPKFPFWIMCQVLRPQSSLFKQPKLPYRAWGRCFPGILTRVSQSSTRNSMAHKMRCGRSMDMETQMPTGMGLKSVLLLMLHLLRHWTLKNTETQYSNLAFKVVIKVYLSREEECLNIF